MAQTCVSVYVGVSIFVVDVLLLTSTLPLTLPSPCHASLLSPIPYSSFLSAQSVFRIIIKFYFRHSIWEMSSVPDGFLTSPVIEYVRLFPTSFLVSTSFFFFLLFGCLAADNFDVFSILRFFFCFAFSLFVRLLLKV